MALAISTRDNIRAASSEALLISALINQQDCQAASKFGVVPGHFIGYKDEYNWLLNYLATYASEPSWDAFKEAFPTFRRSDHSDVRSACDMVFKSFGKRNITEAMSEAMELMGLGDVHAAHAVLVRAEPLRANPKPKKLLTDISFLDNWDDELHVIDTPYPTLNRVTGGMRAGQLWYMAARPKNGKSAHLVNIVTKAVLDGCRVKFFSLEMSEAEVRARFHARLAHQFGYRGITLTGIRDRTVDKHDYKQFVTELQDKLENSGGILDIHSPKDGLVTPGVVRGGADEYHLNAIDYIGLMRGDDGGRTQDWQNLAGISNDLKIMAGTSQSCFLVASQINREGEVGHEPPKLSNLAGSDALGQDGDVVITMRKKPHNVGTAFSVEGNRHGEEVKFYTEFDPNTGTFGEVSKEHLEELTLLAEERL
jgi:hypothetical protein